MKRSLFTTRTTTGTGTEEAASSPTTRSPASKRSDRSSDLPSPLRRASCALWCGLSEAVFRLSFFPRTSLRVPTKCWRGGLPRSLGAMFFENTEEILSDVSGRTFPQPPLVWRTGDGGLWVRALKENRRPGPDTKLCFAPYWNLSESGDVCLGSMRAPGVSTVAAIQQWEQSFYESAFTHGNVGRIVRHAGGFEGLWRELVTQEEFPVEELVELPQTVAEFIQPGRNRYVP